MISPVRPPGNGKIIARAASNLPKSKFLRLFDFENIGTTAIMQSRVLYATSIATRLVAGIVRSYQEARGLYPDDDRKTALKHMSFSEPREHLIRDAISFTVFYFISPPVERFILNMSPYRKELFEGAASPKPGFISKLKSIINGPITTIDQLRDQEKQAIHLATALKKAGKPAPSEAQIQKLLKSMKNWHYIAYLTGLATVLILIGVGVGALNIQLMKRDLARRKQRQLEARQNKTTTQPTAPKPPPVSFSQVNLAASPFAGASFVQMKPEDKYHEPVSKS